MTLPKESDLPVLPTVECGFCHVVVPDSGFCGACGAHLIHEGFQGAQRLHSYAAFPDEPVLHLSQVSTLFPNLSHRAKAPFRAALGLIVVLLVACALGGAAAPLIAVCALGVPLLFILYLWEVDPYESSFLIPTEIAVLIGACLGASWALIAGPYVDGALLPSPATSLTDGRSLGAAILVPVIAQLLMCVPLVVVRLVQRGRMESLDGFAAGSTGALGFTLASTITLLAPWLGSGQLLHQSITTSLAQAVAHGLTWPLVSAMATGLVGTAWCVTLGSGPTSARGRWTTSPFLALGVALLVQVGLGFTFVAGLPGSVLIVVGLLAIVLVIVLVRIVLHHVLLHEAQGVQIGAPRICPQCSHLVPTMPFCPNCGISDRALARRVRAPSTPQASARSAREVEP